MGSGFGHGLRAGSSKSLIEDEADLSDWVGGLNSNSFKKTRLYTDSENDEDDVGSGGFRGGERAGKRRRDADFDKNFDFASRRGGRSRSSSDLELPNRRGGRQRPGESFSGRRKNEGDSNISLFGVRGRGRNLSGFNRGGKSGGLSEEEGEINNGFLRRGNEGRRGKRLGERGSEMQYKNGRNRGGDRGGLAIKRERKGMERRGFVATGDEDMEEEQEEEKKDNGYMSFKELIDSDEVDEDTEEEEEGADGLFDKGSSFPQSIQSALGKSDSYLSESR